MKRFLAVFTGSPDGASSWEDLTEEERTRKRTEGMIAWTKWAQEHAAAIVEIGGPLGKTKRISQSGVAESRNNLAAYTIVQAESPDAAAAMFLNHPHFTIFPGDGVEVMEVLPVPTK